MFAQLPAAGIAYICTVYVDGFVGKSKITKELGIICIVNEISYGEFTTGKINSFVSDKIFNFFVYVTKKRERSFSISTSPFSLIESKIFMT